MSTESTEIRLTYGRGQIWQLTIPTDRVLAYHAAPAQLSNLEQALQQVLDAPLDFPPLRQAVVPGDKVVLAVDSRTPAAAEIVAAMCGALQSAGVDLADIEVVRPHTSEPTQPEDSPVAWRVHQPANEKGHAYLATTLAGERVYLDRALVEADVVFPVGPLGFDRTWGYRGTNSVLYPGLSTKAAEAPPGEAGQSDLEPSDDRQRRETIDEVGWLLGTLFCLQVVPAADNGVAELIAGIEPEVFRKGKELLARHWSVTVPQRADRVVLTLDRDQEETSWTELGQAAQVARQLVTRGGKVVILSDLRAPLGDGLQLLHDAHSPREALQALRHQPVPDRSVAMTLGELVGWADVYLLSQLPDDTVEELFLFPLDSPKAAERLLQGEETCIFLGGAQHTHAQVGISNE